MNPVPLRRMRASAVGTWVCVPTTSAARPSHQAASAAFSLVASMCASTTRIGRRSGMEPSTSSTAANGSLAGSGKKILPSTVHT